MDFCPFLCDRSNFLRIHAEILKNTVRTQPHFFQIKFFHSCLNSFTQSLKLCSFIFNLIRCNGRTFYSYTVLFDCICSFYSHFIISFVAIFQPQVIILDVNIQVWKYELKFKALGFKYLLPKKRQNKMALRHQ